MTPQKTIIKAFKEMAPDYEAKVDGELKRFWGWNYPSFIEQLIAVTPLRPGDKVLDIATGTGFIPRHLFSNGHSPSQVVGVDITWRMLAQGKQLIHSDRLEDVVSLTCASAMRMPFRTDSFDLAFCGLASHHMSVSELLSESFRVLKPGGLITFADVGSNEAWRNPLVNVFLRIGAFFYFVFKEGFSRAIAESNSLSNILTIEEWKYRLAEHHFTGIRIERLPAGHFWSPAPLVIQATKP